MALTFIIPACDEEQVIGAVLDELRPVADRHGFPIIVGVNGTTDATAEAARAAGAMTAVTEPRGYGYGCQAAINLANELEPAIRGYVFVSADGSNDPADLPALVRAFEAGNDLVIGTRTRSAENRRVMSSQRYLANRILGAWCAVAGGRGFSDLGPFRIVSRDLFERMALREWTYGWTVEAQVRAGILGARVTEVPVRERPRIGGKQKVSGVSWRQTLRVAMHILAASARAGRTARYNAAPAARPQPAEVCSA